MTAKYLDKIITESIKSILLESQESKSQSQAISYLQKRMGWDFEYADHFVRTILRQQVNALRNPQLAKFTLGVARMYCDGDLEGTKDDELSETLFAMSSDINKYDKNLNNLSAQELINIYSQTIKDDTENNKIELNSMVFNSSNYKIVKINSFLEAEKYARYLEFRYQWCITKTRSFFNQYSKNGRYQIYFCLRDDFKNTPCKVGDNAPLDDYGLSMISVIVNEHGRLAKCTSRWNGANGGSDNIMNATELSKLLGVNFYEVFKPVNNGLQVVQLEDGKFNISNGKGGYLFKFSFDEISPFHYGFAKVKYQNKYNFINAKNGKLISKDWYDYASDFDCVGELGLHTEVGINKKYNFLNKNGKLISKQWFDLTDGYTGTNDYDMRPNVSINGEWVNINKKGEILKYGQPYDISESLIKNILKENIKKYI